MDQICMSKCAANQRRFQSRESSRLNVYDVGRWLFGLNDKTGGSHREIGNFDFVRKPSYNCCRQLLLSSITVVPKILRSHSLWTFHGLRKNRNDPWRPEWTHGQHAIAIGFIRITKLDIAQYSHRIHPRCISYVFFVHHILLTFSFFLWNGIFY